MESSEIQQLIGSLVLKRHRLVLDFRAAEEDFSADSAKWYADEKILKQDLRDKDVLIAELTNKLNYAIGGAGFGNAAAFELSYAEHKQRPDARELAMAQTKGEFTMAVDRYMERTGLTREKAKQNLKEALGLAKSCV
jgi:hypothetical protein